MNADEPRRPTSFWRSRTGIALCGFIAIAALLLILEHRVHVWQWLPFALLLACPLMHLFHGHGGHGGYGGHGGHGGGHGDKSGKPTAPDPEKRA